MVASRKTFEQKLRALKGYLEWHCEGWEARQTLQHIANAMTKRGYRMGPATVQRMTKPLRLAGVVVCTDDTPKTGGVYIGTCRADVDATLAHFDSRIDGLLETRNCLRALRDEKFPRVRAELAESLSR